MNWDRGFKLTYIVLSILIFTVGFWAHWEGENRTKEVLCSDLPEAVKKKFREDRKACRGSEFTNLTAIIPRTNTEIFQGTLEKAVPNLIKFWIPVSIIWWLIRWAIMGFKKTSSARNWPEGPDE